MFERYYSDQINFIHVKSLGAALGEISMDDNNIDLILLDLNLDDSRGVQTLKIFKEHCNYIPIVIMSGVSEQSVIDTAILSGADSYIIKGHDSPSLVAEEVEHVLCNFKYKMENKLKPGKRMNVA
jgi:DNA-binding NarL/FixJ family response regulator